MRKPIFAIAVLLLTGPVSTTAWAGPDPGAALAGLVATPLDVVGDAGGGVGLIGAAALGAVADGVSLLDANPWSARVLGGAASGALKRVAWGVSSVSTGWLEGLRGEDVERLPEARAAYLQAAPFIGRLDTGLGGVSALWLAGVDLLTGPTHALARGFGADAFAERVDRYRRDARTRALGPLTREDTRDPLP